MQPEYVTKPPHKCFCKKTWATKEQTKGEKVWCKTLQNNPSVERCSNMGKREISFEKWLEPERQSKLWDSLCLFGYWTLVTAFFFVRHESRVFFLLTWTRQETIQMQLLQTSRFPFCLQQWHRSFKLCLLDIGCLACWGTTTMTLPTLWCTRSKMPSRLSKRMLWHGERLWRRTSQRRKQKCILFCPIIAWVEPIMVQEQALNSLHHLFLWFHSTTRS